jgi:SAM-dependent methyltransferase
MSQPLVNPYTSDFYVAHKDGSRRSAEVLAPIVIRLINPRSVVDVGCGVGTWLSVFKTVGVTDILGLDGDHLAQSQLEIDKDVFLAVDLTRRIQLERQFDLVLSLEVAEHLPEECASGFVESLTRLGPVVLFSAAIPHQGGTRHLNEQWPEYWASHFKNHGYEAIDSIRRRVWNDDRVEWWYAQNTVLFVDGEYLSRHQLLLRELQAAPSSIPPSLVHPRKYLDVVRIQIAAQELASLIPLSASFILVDQDQLRWDLTLSRCIIPFPEHEDRYWGLPANDQAAIHELERLRSTGVNDIVFAWPAFWWLDFYKEFAQYLRTHFSCSLDNERLMAFDMRQNPRSALVNARHSPSA